MELQSALDKFLLLDRAKSTRETYSKVLARFVTDIGPGRPIQLITPEDVNAYVLKLRDRTRKWDTHPSRPPVHEPLAAATVYKHIKTIKRFFNWCVERGYLAESPARQLVNRRPRLLLGEGKAATEAEVRAVLRQARSDRRNFAIVLLLVESGARASELAGLKIRNLRLDECSAIVDGKGDKRRTIRFLPDAADAVRAWLKKRPDAPHDYVFVSTRGRGKLNPQAISQLTRRLCRAADLDRELGAHAFRHYVGTKLARERVGLPIAQEWLGHSDPSITMQYQRSLDNDDIQAAGEALRILPEDEDDIREVRREVKKKPGSVEPG